MKHIVAICGIETVRDKAGVVKKLSETFRNNVRTIEHDSVGDKVSVVDARSFLKSENPVSDMMTHIASLGAIDTLVYSGHSDSENLYVFSHVRTELIDEFRVIGKNTDWKSPKFSETGGVFLCGCQAGGQKGVRFPECIAQWIADSIKVTVSAFVSKSSQRSRRDGWYIQVPDIKRVEKFIPRK